MAIEAEKRPPWWLQDGPILPIDRKRSPATVLRTNPLSEPEQPTGWPLIILGVAAVFAVAIGINYWIAHRGSMPDGVPAKVTRAGVTPVARPTPRLALGLKSGDQAWAGRHIILKLAHGEPIASDGSPTFECRTCGGVVLGCVKSEQSRTCAVECPCGAFSEIAR